MEKKNFIPLGDNILLVRMDAPKKTESGIILPDNINNNMIKLQCYISAVGCDVKNKNDLKEGAVVIIPRHTGIYCPIDNDNHYIIVKEKDIIAVFTDMHVESKEN